MALGTMAIASSASLPELLNDLSFIFVWRLDHSGQTNGI